MHLIILPFALLTIYPGVALSVGVFYHHFILLKKRSNTTTTTFIELVHVFAVLKPGKLEFDEKTAWGVVIHLIFPFFHHIQEHVPPCHLAGVTYLVIIIPKNQNFL